MGFYCLRKKKADRADESEGFQVSYSLKVIKLRVTHAAVFERDVISKQLSRIEGNKMPRKPKWCVCVCGGGGV